MLSFCKKISMLPCDIEKLKWNLPGTNALNFTINKNKAVFKRIHLDRLQQSNDQRKSSSDIFFTQRTYTHRHKLSNKQLRIVHYH
jgi:hypothetical protein